MAFRASVKTLQVVLKQEVEAFTCTPLMFAVALRAECVDVLLRYDAQPKTKNMLYDNVDAVNILISCGASVKVITLHKRECVLASALHEHCNALDICCWSTAPTPMWWTRKPHMAPLIRVVVNIIDPEEPPRAMETMKQLLKHSANANATTRDGTSALCRLCFDV